MMHDTIRMVKQKSKIAIVRQYAYIVITTIMKQCGEILDSSEF